MTERKENFILVKLNKRDLKELDNDLQAAYSLMSLAVSECNMLQRLVIAGNHAPTGQALLDTISAAQQRMLLRIWAAKLHEFLDAISSKETLNATKVWADLAKEVIRRLDAIKDSEIGKAVNRDLRNEATHHYSMKAAQKNLDYVSPTAEFGLYLNKKNGNCFYPAGEEVMIIGRLNRFNRRTSASSADTLIESYRKFLDWATEANKILNETFEAFIKRHIINTNIFRRDSVDIAVLEAMAHYIDQPSLPVITMAPESLHLRTHNTAKPERDSEATSTSS